MKRAAVAAVSAALAAVLFPATIGGAQDIPSGNGFLTITHAATTDYPGNTNPLVVCIAGANPSTMEVGDQVEVEEAPGPVEVTVFFNDAAQCSDTPDLSSSVSFEAGVFKGLSIGNDDLATFTYDDDCVPAGDARLLLVNSAIPSVDVYGQADGPLTELAAGLAPGATALLPDVTAGTYDLWIYEAGASTDGPPLTVLENQDLAEGTSTQLFLAGGDDNVGFGGFSFQQGPEVCDDAEAPTTTAAVVTSTTTTTVPAGTATPATPVSGTAAYTG